MALLQVNFFGESIGKESGMLVLMPPGKGPFPVLYLLHGLSDNHTIWLRRTSLERYAADLNLIVVMPDGHRSFYINDPRPGGSAYEHHITRDVVGFCDRVFPTLSQRHARAIAGLSMGGYGAFMLALKNPDLFGVAASHSGALGFAHKMPPEFEPLSDHVGAQHDCFQLASALKKSGRRQIPHLRFDCGKDDFLLEHNRRFHSHLERLGYPHEYEEHNGQHNWEYWDRHIQETLPFVMRHVKQTPLASRKA